MTNDEQNPNAQNEENAIGLVISLLGFRHSFDIRHPGLVILRVAHRNYV